MKTINLGDHFTFKKLLRFVAPCISMMIVTSIYGIVDGFFVSNYAGKNAFAAVNLVMPVIMAMSAFGFMIGTGGSALVAFTFGEGKKQRGQEIFTMLIRLVILVGLTVSALGFLFMPLLVDALGASEMIRRDCILYGRISMCSLTCFMMQNSYQSFLVTAEKPTMGLIISISAGVLNMVLDFLFVYVFRLGVVGAATATACSEITGALVPTIYFFRKNNSCLRFVKTKFDGRAIVRACTNGLSEMLTNLSTSVVGMLYNIQLMRLAAENGIAAYGVIMYVSFIFMAIYFGYSVGINPVIGFHYGAGNKKELSNVLKKSLFLTAIAALTMCILAETFSQPFAAIFVGYDKFLCEMTTVAMRIYALSFLLNGFNIFTSAFFTGLNNGKISALISILRTLVIQVLAILLLPVFFGINGVWSAIVVAEGLTLIVSVSLLCKYRKKYGY